MRYIGPFFRMNTLSQKEINGQLFHLSKEAVRTLVLESKCGLAASIRDYKKSSSSIDITTIGNFSPLLCIYKKSSPNYIHSKNYNGFDEDSFKKDIIPITNALMTLNILELVDYYRSFKDIDNSIYSYYEIYKKLSKDQLEFYSENLRNNEGVFIEKKNLLENNTKGFNLVGKDKKFKFSDQAFMMAAYNLYSIKFPDDDISKDYNTFSLEILQMFLDFKDKLYENSFEELCKTLMAINIFYSHSNNEDAKILIIDLTDFLINKFDEKDYYVDALDFSALFAINLMLSYKHTQMITFNEKSKEIMDKLLTLYDSDKEIFLKLSSKKDIKYSNFDITFYLLAFIMYANDDSRYSEYKHMISSLYRKYFINSGLISSWPEAPTLDDAERYRGLTLNSSDMLDESFFRMPNLSSPSSSGIAPIFNKNVSYSKKRDSFSASSSSFDSFKNMYIYQLLIFLFKDDYMKETKLLNIRLPLNIIPVEEQITIEEIPVESNDSVSPVEHIDTLENIEALDTSNKLISQNENKEKSE
ncbi:hypothetical protein JCM1393_16210 [Clostridium carnis]